MLVDVSTDVVNDVPYFESPTTHQSSNPSWVDLDLASIGKSSISSSSLEDPVTSSVFQLRLYSVPINKKKEDASLIVKRLIDLKLMIHLGLNLRPSYMDPSIKFLQDLPLDTFIIELKDGFYSTQSVALYLRSTSVLDSITTEDIDHSEYDVEVDINILLYIYICI